MKVLYDTKLMRPGCVILCAGYGADSAPAHHFDTQDWLLAPTDNLAVYDTTKEQLKQLVVMTRAHREKRNAVKP